jgi:hypothetical protein
MKPNEINSGHYLELMDRTHVIMDNINSHLLEHPLTDNENDLKEKFEIALDALWDAYQLIGNKEIVYENKNNAH